MNVEHEIATVERMYDDSIRCARGNECKHQVFRWSCFSGGRYSCAISNSWPESNCIIRKEGDTCEHYEKK